MPRSSGKRETAVFNYIKNSLANGYSPSVREIMSAMGFKSTSTVQYYIESLSKKGLIEKQKNCNRTLKLPNSECVPVAVLNDITAENAFTSPQNIRGYVSIQDNGKDSKEFFATVVKGDSMKGEGILDGDIIIVYSTETAENGQLAVFADEQGNVEIKRVSSESSEGKILGCVIGIKRYY